MKRVIGLVAFCGAASCIAASAAAPLAHHAPLARKVSAKERAALKAAALKARILSLAPADEYFGPLKQSVIGINNTIRQLGWNYDVNHDIGNQSLSSAGLTERAITDWERKYPKDDQLPRSLYLLQRLYTKILTQAARDRANYVAVWMFRDFSKSPQARQLHKTLALEHLAPIPPPTPAPTPAAAFGSIFGPAFPSIFSATPIPVPAVSPQAAASANPQPHP